MVSLRSICKDFISPGERMKAPYGVRVHDLCEQFPEEVKDNLPLIPDAQVIAFTAPSLSFGKLIRPDCKLLRITEKGFGMEEFEGDVVLVKDVVTEGNITQQALDYLAGRGNRVILAIAFFSFGSPKLTCPFSALLYASQLGVQAQQTSTARTAD
jgi:hypothetical protein